MGAWATHHGAGRTQGGWLVMTVGHVDPVALVVGLLSSRGVDACAGVDVDTVTNLPVVLVEPVGYTPVHQASWRWARSGRLVVHAVAATSLAALDELESALGVLDDAWRAGETVEDAWLSSFSVDATPMVVPVDELVAREVGQARAEVTVVARSQ